MRMPVDTATRSSAIIVRADTRSTTLSDEAIVERVKSGDVASFELLMRRYNQRLFRVARGILNEEHEAEDAVQEAYVRAYERLGQFNGDSRFATWLTKIVVNGAITRRDKGRRLRLLASPDVMETQVRVDTLKPGPLDAACLSELRQLLTAEVDRLPRNFRIVFVMRAVEGMNTRDAAACLNLTEANVKVRYHRARALLRERITKRIGEDAKHLYQFDGERCDRIVSSVMKRLPHLQPGTRG